MKSVSQPERPVPSPTKVSYEQVALRAFSKWLARGCPEGDPDTDWYAALKEMEGERRQRTHNEAYNQPQQAMEHDPSPQNEALSQHRAFARWTAPSVSQSTAWWAVYGKVRDSDGVPERCF